MTTVYCPQCGHAAIVPLPVISSTEVQFENSGTTSRIGTVRVSFGPVVVGSHYCPPHRLEALPADQPPQDVP